MAMISALLETELVAELTAQHPVIFPEVSGQPDQATNVTRMIQFISKIATPIVLHIQTNAIVTTSVTGTCTGTTGVGSPGGPLPIASQPVTAAGTGTVA